MFLTDLNPLYLMALRRSIVRNSIDLVIVSEPYGIGSASLVSLGVPIIYDAHDVVADHANIAWKRVSLDFRLARLPIVRQFLREIFIGLVRVIELISCRRSNRIAVLSPLDQQRFCTLYRVPPERTVLVKPWYEPKQKLIGTKDNLVTNVVFHGIYRHPSNLEAFKTIEEYIAPELQKRDNTIRVLLAGTDLPPYERGNIRSYGHVPNLEAFLALGDVAIVPTTSGTGIRTKVFDYISHGIPIVSTVKGVEGIGLVNGVHAVICESVDETFLDSVISLAKSESKRISLARNALNLLTTEYSRRTSAEQVQVLLRGL
ncbi:MAG: glycosyltransferase [Nitrososphaerota archaeon]|nr:glycosyltransferase [Nitrososphaerota archaeon]